MISRWHNMGILGKEEFWAGAQPNPSQHMHSESPQTEIAGDNPCSQHLPDHKCPMVFYVDPVVWPQRDSAKLYSKIGHSCRSWDFVEDAFERIVAVSETRNPAAQLAIEQSSRSNRRFWRLVGTPAQTRGSNKLATAPVRLDLNRLVTSLLLTRSVPEFGRDAEVRRNRHRLPSAKEFRSTSDRRESRRG